MSLYDKYVLPKVIHFVCGMSSSMKQREKVIPLAAGDVLEVGVGTGLNLDLYDPAQVRQLTAIDPSPETWAEYNGDPSALGFEFEFLQAAAESLPMESNTFDTVVLTYTMCTIPDNAAALLELRRVLKPGGKLIFCEHGKAPDRAIEMIQRTINPVWKQFSGGCHINRDIPRIILDNGFAIDDLQTMYIPGWKPASFNYWGMASAR